jgi:adenine-specific DNA-methyltransferase
MLPRIQLMRQMLKSNGVLAFCIDNNEFLRLGMILDEVFGESNRIAIIN